MSELKVHSFDDFSLHDMVNCKFYLKSEVDEIIEEKNKEIEGWKAGYSNLINVDIPRIEANLKKEIENLKNKEGVSESLKLKAIRSGDIHDDVEFTYDTDGEDRAGVLYYLKSEADKVIAEKDKQIEELKKEKEYAIEHMAEVINGQERENRYQKNRRCLSMAKWCDDAARLATWDNDFDLCRWYNKWMQRWLKIAEQFKEKNEN